MNDDASIYNDTYCLLKLSEGDEKFFNLLFRRYRDQLFTYLFKVTKSRETAEEIVLDVFLKLWHGREGVTKIENLGAFLHRVAHNKAIDFFRSLKRSPKLQEQVWELMTDAISSEPADKFLVKDDPGNIVLEAAKRLSPQRKIVFFLRYQEGLSYNEIAEKMNLSSNTVRNHLAASLQFIREFLADNNQFLFFFLLFIKNNHVD